DGYQLAALQVESKAVVPAGDGALVEAHGLLGQPHATVQTLILERIDLAVHATQHDRDAADLNTFDVVFRQLIGKQCRIPMVDKAPGSILVRLILALGLGIVGAGIADAVFDDAAADDWLGHDRSLD